MTEEEKKKKRLDRIHSMKLRDVYPLYVEKVEKKGKDSTRIEELILWLTGYDRMMLHEELEKGTDFKTFFAACPQFSEKVGLIKGKICGYEIATIEDETEKRMRYLDKLVDDLSRGAAMKYLQP